MLNIGDIIDNKYEVIGTQIRYKTQVYDLKCLDCNNMYYGISEEIIYKFINYHKGCNHNLLINFYNTKYKINDILFNNYAIIAFKGIIENSTRYDVKCIKCGYIYYNQSINMIKKRALNHKVSCNNHSGNIGKTGYRTYKWKNPKAMKIYFGMMARCYNERDKSYVNYGGRGIKVCDEWRNNRSTFDDWCTKSGFKPGLTIGRIDVNGNYCPENCEWQTINFNAAHQKRNIKEYTIVDLENNTVNTMNLAEISRAFGSSTGYLTSIRKNQGYQELSNKLDDLSKQGFIKNGEAKLYNENKLTKYTVIDFDNNTSQEMYLMQISKYYGFTPSYLSRLRKNDEKAFLNKMNELSYINPSEIKHKKYKDSEITIVDLEKGTKEILSLNKLSLKLHHSKSWLAERMRNDKINNKIINELDEIDD